MKSTQQELLQELERLKRQIAELQHQKQEADKLNEALCESFIRLENKHRRSIGRELSYCEILFQLTDRSSHELLNDYISRNSLLLQTNPKTSFRSN